MVEFRKLFALVGRNIKCYFKDKVIFFVSLISPVVLLVLFATFLRNVYIQSFKDVIGESAVSSRAMEGIVGAWLFSSILAVSSVTVAFCSNIVMVQDKIDGTITDLKVSPIKRTTISVSYFVANFIITLLIMLCVLAVGCIYLAAVGWYIPVGDFFMILVDIFCCVLFGTLLASIIMSFIKSQGASSAVSSLISSMYGFICGAYMPLSQFAGGLRNFIGCLPGTYGVGILRNHFMNGYITEFVREGVPEERVKVLKDVFDGNLYVGATQIPLWAMYVILLGTCAILLAAYIAIVLVKNKKKL